MQLTPAQCRAARALLDLSQKQLAGASQVGLRTIVNFENGTTTPTTNNLAAIHRALEAAGVIFIAPNGEGPGVRLRKDQPPA